MSSSRRRRAAACAAATVASTSGGGMEILNNQRVFYARIDYVWDQETEELMIEIESDEEIKGLFGTKKKKVLVPLPEGIKKFLPKEAKVLNIVLDWYNDRARVYYTK